MEIIARATVTTDCALCGYAIFTYSKCLHADGSITDDKDTCPKGHPIKWRITMTPAEIQASARAEAQLGRA
jgi:hypothetical protein